MIYLRSLPAWICLAFLCGPAARGAEEGSSGLTEFALEIAHLAYFKMDVDAVLPHFHPDAKYGGKPAKGEYKENGARMVPLEKRSLLRIDLLQSDSEMDPFRERNPSKALKRPDFPELQKGDLVCVLTWRVVFVKDRPVEWFTFFVIGNRDGKMGIVHMDDT